ncbi:MAG: glycoside hydrolase family 68 protein [Erythrobacter sp.]|uniref:glycoside hydrolase family 68 protein n=1 Tax=Erythrobacter sp. TaxID=1042 RepID=UPI0025E3A1F9|nr:glycoside hydrolase family 68 protein [Erythrobacter sp.]MCL9998495.1 glycoside hydrolase family 68 protein [Erythrobacter sp.]
MTSMWTAEQVRRIAAIPGAGALIPPVGGAGHGALDPARLYWDMWPLQDTAGHRTLLAGRELWMALTAPDCGDPALRHFEAKIHWLERMGDGWTDHGPVLPDMPVSYEREWAGSALLHDGTVTLFFTAAGTDTRAGGYQQELWAATAPVGEDGWPTGWSAPAPLVTGYGPHYMPADAHEGEAGKIKAFRDPAYFRDPADGAEYLAFTASLAGSASAFNGAFGLARKGNDGTWELIAPAIHADGVNNELERAHLVFHAGSYYAFWSTQTATFAEGLRHVPGGLYGMVADSMAGPWRPLNGTGLVLANPADRPQQTYSWYVDADLTVCSFVDLLPDDRFGGVPAPLLHLTLDGERAELAA